VDPWLSLLIAFGGNAALLLVLGFLGRSLLLSILAKDIEKFKADLRIAAIEHEVRFSKLHEKRVEVLAKLYKLLVAAAAHITSAVSPAQRTDAPDKSDQYRKVHEASAEYFWFFDQHRIWLPPDLCKLLDAFEKKLRTTMPELLLCIKDSNGATAKETEEISKLREGMCKSVEEDVPTLRTAIEAEFRSLLGAGEAKTD